MAAPSLSRTPQPTSRAGARLYSLRKEHCSTHSRARFTCGWIGPLGRHSSEVCFCIAGRQSSAVAAATGFVRKDRLEDAIKSLYENPNYDIYTTKPTERHEQVLVHRWPSSRTCRLLVLRALFASCFG